MEDIAEGSTPTDTCNTIHRCPVNITKSEPAISSTIIEENMGQLGLGESKIEDIINLEPKNISKCSLKAAPLNRRYSLRPQKRLQTTELAVSSLKKKITGRLETIFEEPQRRNGSIILLGRALKRSIAFNDSKNLKVKRRRCKIKRLCKNYKKKALKITLEDVKRKLKCLEDCENSEWVDITEPS